MELGEVEATLRSVNSSVTQAVVLLHRQSLVSSMTPGSVDAPAFKTGAFKVLPSHTAPSVVLSVDFTPNTLSGKAD